MIDFSISDITSVLNGKWINEGNLPDSGISQIVTDSRTFFKKENVLFFAITGPRNNGHLYISDLIQKGVKAFVISDEKFVSNQAHFIVVENTVSALQKLAAYNRSQFSYPVVGITGSNGTCRHPYTCSGVGSGP